MVSNKTNSVADSPATNSDFNPQTKVLFAETEAVNMKHRVPRALKKAEAVQTGPSSALSFTIRLEQEAETNNGRCSNAPFANSHCQSYREKD